MINTILTGDSREMLTLLAKESIDCVVTSPPYFNLRNYHVEGQIGLEDTPDIYIKKLVDVFYQVWRVMKKTATLWVIIGDSYAGSGKGCDGKTAYLKGIKNYKSKRDKPKSLIGIPWRFALVMIEAGWILRQDIIWAKRNPMPEAVKDRFCKSHEHIFLFTKQGKYYFDYTQALEKAIGWDRDIDGKCKYSHYKPGAEFIKNNQPRYPQRGFAEKEENSGQRPQHHGAVIETLPLRTMRDVWFIPTEAYQGEHYATYPERLITPCVLCGCPQDGVVLDPFFGIGTTGAVAKKNYRNYIGCEINPAYVKIARKRISNIDPLFNEKEELCI